MARMGRPRLGDLGKTTTRAIKLSKVLDDALVSYAASQGRDVSSCIRGWIVQGLGLTEDT